MNACATAGACPLCNGSNACRMVTSHAYKGPCWCEQTEIPAGLLAQVTAESRGRACLCPTCVGNFQRERGYQPKPGPGDHYYDSQGRWVFTEAYHRRRGYCCGSGCRHCPYPLANIAETA